MYGLQREMMTRSLPILLLFGALALVYLGVPSVLPLNPDADWPRVPLVSAPAGTAPDVWSSVPGLLQLLFSALQAIVLVEIARLVWILKGTVTAPRYLLTFAYEIALIVDMFRLWGRDWQVWVLHQLSLSELCPEAAPCFPASDAVPWPSMSVLVVTFVVLKMDRSRAFHPDSGSRTT